MSSWLVLVARGLALGCLWLEFGAHLAPFGLPLGPLGAPWNPRGLPWGPSGVPWGSLWGSLGLPWGALGCPGRFSRIFRKLDAQFRANVSIRTRLRIESSLPEFARGARGARCASGNGSQSAAQTPPGHTRRGLGLRELNKLPQMTSKLDNCTHGQDISTKML